jgi:GNAT superfamily N-acetyltransferase
MPRGFRLLHTDSMIRLGTPSDLDTITDVYRSASLSNAGDRDRLLAHPEYLVLEPEGLTEGRTHVAEEDGSVVGFATWAETDGGIELEDLFVDPKWMRRGIATALVDRIADVVRSRDADTLEVTASPDALEFYRALGFIDAGVAETAFGSAPRMLLTDAPRLLGGSHDRVALGAAFSGRRRHRAPKGAARDPKDPR